MLWFGCASTSQLTDRLAHPIGRAGGGFHAPVQIVRIRADEVNPAHWLHDIRNELLQLPDTEGFPLADRRPAIHGPLMRDDALDLDGLARITAAISLQRLFIGGAG